MTNDPTKKEQPNDITESTPKPDEETLHTTDPQKEMKGPVSSSMQKTGSAFTTDKSREEANKEHEKNY